MMARPDKLPFLTSENLAKLKKPHKYHARRTEYNGERYDSKAEAEYAATLDLLLKSREIKDWERQVLVPLGADDSLRVDFIVYEYHETYAVDVKGVETADFKRKKRLWKQYGTMDLQIMKRVGSRWQVSRVRGGMAAENENS
jgi:hypothetical protein